MPKINASFAFTTSSGEAVELTKETFGKLFLANQILTNLMIAKKMTPQLEKSSKGYIYLSRQSLDEFIRLTFNATEEEED